MTMGLNEARAPGDHAMTPARPAGNPEQEITEMSGWLDLENAREHRSELLREAEGWRLAQRSGETRKIQMKPLHGQEAREPVQREIEIRWGLSGDEPRIAELLDLNGMSRRAAFEEQFVVAQENGEVLAAVGYRTSPKRLHLELLVADPWAGERELAVALYAGVGDLAREMGVREILARPDGRADYPREAGYRRRAGEWRLDATPSPGGRAGLPARGWLKIFGFWSASASRKR